MPTALTYFLSYHEYELLLLLSFKVGKRAEGYQKDSFMIDVSIKPKPDEMSVLPVKGVLFFL